MVYRKVKICESGVLDLQNLIKGQRNINKQYKQVNNLISFVNTRNYYLVMFYKMNTYYIFTLSTAIPSILVSSFILLYFGNNPHLRNSIESSFYFIVIHSIDLFLSIALIINPYPSEDFLCYFQAYVQQSLSLSLILWVSLISISLFYDFIIKGGQKTFPIKKSLIIVLFLSALVSLIPFKFNAYSKISPYCNIKFGNDYDYVMLFFFYIPFVLSSLITGICLYFIVKFVRKRCRKEYSKLYINVLISFPIILSVCYTPLFITRITQMQSDEVKGFYCFSYALSSSYGFLTGLVVLYSVKKTKILWSRKFEKSLGVINTNAMLS